MYLVEFTYDHYCQGTRDECQARALVPDARTFQQAVEAVQQQARWLHPRWEKPRDFKDCTILRDEIAELARSAFDDIEDEESQKQIAEQQRFVNWLQVQGIYNPYASANMMRSMHQVWRKMMECPECGAVRNDDMTCPECDDDC